MTRARTRAERGRHSGGRQVLRHRIDVGDNRPRAPLHHRRGGRDEGLGRDDDLVAGADVEAV